MNPIRLLACGTMSAALIALAHAAEQPPNRFAPARPRLAEITAWLALQPAGIGAPASERTVWNRAGEMLPRGDLLAAAATAAAQPVPALPDDLFLAFQRTGDRTEYQRVNKQRLDRLNLFAWAEGLEHQGRFVPALVRELEAIANERTWVLPAHDRKLDNLEGRVVEVDLGAAMRAWTIATAVYWHADQLPPALRARLAAELQRRVFAPYLELVRGGPLLGGMWWIRADNNWNAVCHAGVVGAALALIESPAERAEIVATAELNLEYYLKGFTPDGYCSEGIGYWNYGFGHFAMLSEVMAKATQGKVRPLWGDHAARVAAYPARLQILPGVYPAFADMNVKERPSLWFGALAARQMSPTPLGMPQWGLSVSDLREQLLYETALKVFIPLESVGLPQAAAPAISQSSTWFKEAQVYVGRASERFGAAIKGGHNAENHNHNDLGSYVVVVGDCAVLVDPGLEVYTARTFGPRRYDSKVLNSYGHAVPVVAGQLQHEGREFAATVVSTAFGDQEDSVVFDLTKAYAVPVLKSLIRTFTLRRQPKAGIEVTDTVEFREPAAFETALITFEQWHEVKPGVLVVGESDAAMRVEVTVEGGTWKLQPEVLQEDLPGKRFPTRLGIALDGPVRAASVVLKITPN